MKKVLSFIISAKNKTQEGLSSAFGGIKNFATGVFKNLANIQAGFQMLSAAAKKAYGVLKSAFSYETMTVQFKTLIGSMDEARSHMQMLKELGDTPPFSLDEFAKASRTMLVLSDGVLGLKTSLELVGDAAAATGQPIEQMAHEVARAYAVIRDGQPISRAVMGLKNMGAITPEVAAKLNDMQKAGATNVEMWHELESQLGRFKGAMEETEQTGDGLIGAIGSQWDNTVRAFGDSILDASKDGLGSLLNYLKQINEDGTIEEWAQGVADSVAAVCEQFKEFHEWLNKTGDAKPIDKFDRSRNGNGDPNQSWEDRDSTLMQWANTPTALSSMIAGLINGIFGDSDDSFSARYNAASLAYFAENGHGAQADEAARLFAKLRENDIDIRDQRDQEREHRKQDAAEKRAQRKAEAEAKAAEETARVEEQLAVAQAKREAKDAEEAAKKKAEEDAKAAKKKAEEDEKAARKAAEAQARLDEKLAQERLKALEKERRARVKAAEDEYRAGEKAVGDAERRLSDAQKQTAQAWGWYRDKDSMQAEIDERKAQAEAQKQWEKDFEKLKSRHRDWRSIEFGKLSADEESVRQVALAREEEEAATKALDEIRENTAYLKSIAEALEAEGEG